MKNTLMKKRKASEVVDQVKKAERLFKKLLSFASPKSRVQALEILQKYEAKLRGLDCIPSEIVDEGIYRVQVMTQLHLNRNKNSHYWDWDHWIQDDRPFMAYRTHRNRPQTTTLNLRYFEGEISFELETLEEHINTSKFGALPEYPTTFGQENPVKQQPRLIQAAQGPALDLVVVDPAKRQEQAPVISLQSAKDQAPAKTTTSPAPAAKATMGEAKTNVSTFKAKTVGNKPSEAVQKKPLPKTVVQLGLFYSEKPKQKAKTRKVPTQKPSPEVAVQLSLFDLFEAPSSKAS
jgi:hypothetical protein